MWYISGGSDFSKSVAKEEFVEAMHCLSPSIHTLYLIDINLMNLIGDHLKHHDLDIYVSLLRYVLISSNWSPYIDCMKVIFTVFQNYYN